MWNGIKLQPAIALSKLNVICKSKKTYHQELLLYIVICDRIAPSQCLYISAIYINNSMNLSLHMGSLIIHITEPWNIPSLCAIVF